MTAQRLDGDQPAVEEARQVGAGGLRRGAGQQREFAGRPTRPVRQLQQEGRAHGVADERADRGERGASRVVRSGGRRLQHRATMPAKPPACFTDA
jgi:hypothetical protein